MIATETQNVVQGRWGYYPCSYETYQKLRKLFGFYLKQRRMDAAHERWARKEPQNRVQRERIKDASGRVIGRRIVGPLPEPPQMKVPISHWVEEDYRNARYPKASPADVQPLRLTESAIDQQLKACEEWNQ